LSALLGTVPALTDQLRADARRLEAARELPYKSVQAVRDSVLGALRIPAEYGGPGASLAQLFRVIIDLAEADSNVAQALRPHFGFVELLHSQGTEAERARWYAEVLAGRLFGNASGERGTAHPGVIETRLTHDGDAYRLNGTKFYSTGSLFADYVVVIALDEDDRYVRAVVPRDREGMVLLDDWDSMGQRTTASGTTEFHDVLVHRDEFTLDAAARKRRTHLAPYYQLFLAAVHTGIAKAALADAVVYARDKARAVQHAGVATAVEDPLVQLAVGEIAALAYGAEATVLRAASSIDEALTATGEDGLAGTPESLGPVAVEVCQAQVVAAQAALRAAERLYDVGGASATLREHNFDRHWRNARTVASHNPIPHKARVTGDWLLRDNPPPVNGFF
jgi:alkylation response protein AidB-like acyl-CoA dehydrogenase